MSDRSDGARGWHYLHPFLWAVQPIIFLWARAVQEVRFIEVLVPLGATVLGTVAFWALAYLALRRDLPKSACVTSFALLLFFSFGRLVNAADSFINASKFWPSLVRMQVAGRMLVIQAIVLALFAIIALVARRLLFRRKMLPAWVTPLLARAAAVLILVSAVQIGAALVSAPRRSLPAQEAASAPAPPPAVESPDFYIIVADGYAREDVLREFYNFDNTPFIQALRDLGFRVSSKSSANYSWTFLSLSSALNMTHIQKLAEEAGPDSRDQMKAHEMIRNNAVQGFLKNRGYRTVHFPSAWTGTRTNPYADEIVGSRRHLMHVDFLRALADSSLLVVFNHRLAKDMAAFYLEEFDQLESAASKPGPKMVFAHFLLPHHPYIFDRNGGIVNGVSFVDNVIFRKAQWRKTDAYTDQMTFLNTKLLAAIRAILRSSRVPPVIALFSDHGTFIAEDDTETNRQTRLANLTAVYLPGAPADLIPENVQLVQLFPLILNHVFRAGIEVPPPTRFFSSYTHPYILELAGPDRGFAERGVSEDLVGRKPHASADGPRPESRQK